MDIIPANFTQANRNCVQPVSSESGSKRGGVAQASQPVRYSDNVCVRMYSQ